MSDRFLVFAWAAGEARPAGLELPEGYRVRLWRPAGLRIIPPGPWEKRLIAWGLMHLFGGFRSRDYAALLVETAAGEVAHRSSAFPPYFAFPFMGRDDLQIGLTITEPAHRGKRLAACAIQAMLAAMVVPGRRFWYIVEAENRASVRAVEAAGLRRAGTASRSAGAGTRLLGRYEFHAEEPGGSNDEGHGAT